VQHKSPLRELGDCDAAHQLAKSPAQPVSCERGLWLGFASQQPSVA